MPVGRMPLNERASKCAGQELNLQSPEAGGLQPFRLANAQPTHVSSTGGSRTHRARRFELRRFASLRTALSVSNRKGVPGRIRTDDLHRDRVASTPGCSARTYRIRSLY